MNKSKTKNVEEKQTHFLRLTAENVEKHKQFKSRVKDHPHSAFFIDNEVISLGIDAYLKKYEKELKANENL